MRKKYIILVCVILLICILMQTGIVIAADKAFAGEMIYTYHRNEITFEDYKYLELENNKAAISSYEGIERIVNVPETINGREVTIIACQSFMGNSNIEIVNLPDTVKQIEARSFDNCENLTTIKIPATVDFVGLNFFYECPKVVNYSIPAELVNGSYGRIRLYDIHISGTRDYDLAKEIFDLTNEKRKAEGHEPLKYDYKLSERAMLRAAELSVVGSTSHYRPNGNYGFGAENMAINQYSAEEVISDWMESKPHHDQMMKDSHKAIGVGVYISKEGLPCYIQSFDSSSSSRNSANIRKSRKKRNYTSCRKLWIYRLRNRRTFKNKCT